MEQFTTTIKPRLYETDAMGHINNATIAAWFEVARVRFLESLVGANPMESKGWTLASVQIDFLTETQYGEDVAASITEAEVGNSSLRLQCLMTQGDRVTVRGKAVMVHWDPETRAPTRIGEELRELIAAR
ncbi:MAG: acyl-CoA thioester hydrolase [Halioglobus sp.]